MGKTTDKTNGEESSFMLSRRQARRLALQVLFANEFLHEDILTVANRIADSLNQELSGFSWELILKTAQNQENIDRIIYTNLRGKRLDQLAPLDRVLIRLAISELLFFSDIPIEVTFNEALELTKEFISFRSSKFMNGLLDSIYRYLKSNGQIQKSVITKTKILHSHKYKK